MNNFNSVNQITEKLTPKFIWTEKSEKVKQTYQSQMTQPIGKKLNQNKLNGSKTNEIKHQKSELNNVKDERTENKIPNKGKGKKKQEKSDQQNQLKSMKQVENEKMQSNDGNKIQNDEKSGELDETIQLNRLCLELNKNFGWARTHFECELCTEMYSIKDIVALISCTHYACHQCLQKYFTVQIREKQKLIISCPFCDEPNFHPNDDDGIFEYLGLLDQLIKSIVPNDVYELFQRKVRDRALMRDPNFRWCTQVSEKVNSG